MDLNKRILAILCIVLLAISSQILKAQSVSSSIQGTVLDPSGAVIPKADVTLTNVNTGVVLKSQSDSSGTYSFPTVAPGIYSLQVVAPNFAKYEISRFNVIVGQRATENATLGSVTTAQAVTVNADDLAALLDPESNDLGTVIGPKSVAELPLNGRNFLQLSLLAGAAQAPSGAADSSVSQTGHPSLSINIAGNEPDYTMYLVDGIQTFGSRAGNASLNISVSAIDQFEVHYGFFMPDLGPNPGIVDVITKGGTNHIHGHVYEFVRTNQMEARNWFHVAGKSVPNGPYHQNQFGVDIGGPVLKNKLFYFGNYEGYRQSQSALSLATVPTTAEFGGLFPASDPIYNPYTGNGTPGSRTQFTGNQIPASMIDPVAKALLAYYLPATNSNATDNLAGTPKDTLNSDQVTFRTDYSANDKNQIFGQFSYLNSPVVNSTIFPLDGTSYPLNTELIALGWTRTLNSNMVNDFRLGWTRNSVYDEGASSAGVQTKLGITGTGDANGVPAIGITGYTGFGTGTGLLGDVDNVYQIHDSFSYLKGKHQFKFGGDLDYTRTVDSSANATARGSLTFNDDFSAQLGAATGTTGNAFADFLLGAPESGEAKAMPPTHYRWTSAQPYAEDTWKITPKLTANLALAWYDITSPDPVGDNKNFIHGFNFTTGLETFAALGQMNPEVYSQTKDNFAPRIGFSYQLNSKTDLRGGWGMYYTTQMALNVQYSVVSDIITVNNAVANTGITPTATLGDGVFPPVTVGQITEPEVATITGPIQYLSQNQRNPYIEQYNLDLQRTFGSAYMLDIAFIGNGSHRLAINYNPFDCSSPGSLVCNSANIPYGGKYPYMQEVNSIGWGNYNGLLVKFQRQFTHGLSILANYTYSKALADAQEGGNSTLNQDKSCIRCDYGPTTSNVPQSLVISAVWDLPVGRGRRFGSNINPILNGFIGGWNADIITTLQSGVPFTVSAPNLTQWPADNVRADRTCIAGHAYGLSNKNIRTNGNYFMHPNTAASPNPCFTAPPNVTIAGVSYPTFGTSGFDIYQGPGVDNSDIGVHKDFPIHGAIAFTFRGEFFNAFNHAQFANPDSGIGDGATFGLISALNSAHPQRQIQLGGTIAF